MASKLVEKLPVCLNKFGKPFLQAFYLSKGVVSNSYSFSLVSENRVFDCLRNLSAKKATGLYGIPPSFVRDWAPFIAYPLTHVTAFNLYFIQGVVPDYLKLAGVVPLFKKNDKMKVYNDRPVSGFNRFVKIFIKRSL